MRKYLRLASIASVLIRYRIDEIIAAIFPESRLPAVFGVLFFFRPKAEGSPGERLRKAFESLGPIFVKFGQMLSTRRDFVSADIADELAKLQDQVPPFDPALAANQIKASLGAAPEDVFLSFEREPVAAASIAQVHFAVLKDGREAAVKILRPEVASFIGRDLELLHTLAEIAERLWDDGKRLRLKAVVAEFDRLLHDELDLQREAANFSQLKRNFADSDKLLVPEVYWEYCSEQVLVMQKMTGIPISHVQELREAGVDLEKLAHDGVEIFLTQVFRDAFFHADMHPGNIFVSVDPATFGRYIALDMGIVGMLDDFDKEYLTRNFAAFVARDYKMVARTHIDSGWVPKDTNVLELEAAIRTCCEPMFDRPLKDISFANVLIRLFQTSRRFNVEIQPQLVLLQKTMLNVEGLGRELYPELDLWKAARPHLEAWMAERVGLKGLINRLKAESFNYTQILPAIPLLVKKALEERLSPPPAAPSAEVSRLRRSNTWLIALCCVLAGVIAGHFVPF